MDVTSQWVTNAIDPAGIDGVPDTYGAAHSTYVGGQASPANVGAFYNGTSRLAWKFKVPTNAENVIGTSRRYKFKWKVLMETTPSQIFLEDEETFQVGPIGTVSFGALTVTIAEVEAGITTSLTDAQIQLLITEATNYVYGRLEQAGLEPDQFTSLPRLIRNAIVLMTRYLIFQLDASSYKKTSMLQEGDTRISFTGNSQKDADALLDLLNMLIDQYIGVAMNTRVPQIHVIRLGNPENHI